MRGVTSVGKENFMKLRSSKAALSLGMALVVCFMPFVPVVVGAATTYEQQQSTINQTESKTASYTENVSDLVAAGYEETQETSMFNGKAVAITDPYIEVHASMDEESEVKGRLYTNNIADAVEVGTDWTKIVSGNLTGYVKTSVLCFDQEAEAIATLTGDTTVTVKAETADVYSMSNTDNKLYTAENNQTFKAVAQCGEFTAIYLEDGTKGYILTEDVSTDYGLETGKTNDEAVAYEQALEEARIAKEKAEAEEARRQAEEAKKEAEAQRRQQIIANTISGTDFSYNSSMSASDDEIWLLACIVDWESGTESYEGKLAVANVVLNRVRSSKYANSISGVIYAQGQFTGVLDSAGNVSGRFSSRLSSGPLVNSSMTAALEALSGKNNIGSYTSFRAVSISNPSSYSSYSIIGNHIFY